MGDIMEMTYPDMLNRFRERRNESKILLPLMSEVGSNFESMKHVESCLSIGPGPGEYDLEFLKRCLPNLKKFVAVEKDHYCAEELKKNIIKRYDGTLVHEVFEADIDNWQYEPTVKSNFKFDIVVMFHMLYDLNPQTRKTLLQNILDRWLDADKGVIVVVNMSDDVDAQLGKINVMQNLHRYFSDRMDLLLEADDIKEDLKGIGGEVVWSKKYRCDMDFTVFDKDVTQLFNIYSKIAIDSESMKVALKTAAPHGMATYVGEILIARKKK